MKIIKKDGTIEEGIGISDAQAAEMQHIEETLHIVLCQRDHHYDWYGMPKCKKVAQSVALGGSWMEAMEDLLPKPAPKPEPEPAPEPTVDTVGMDPMNYAESTPVAVATEKVDLPF